MLIDARVSLVIPILNERTVLPELLTAIENQTLRPHEIIFVDAGSTDGSKEYIESWWLRSSWDGGLCKVLSKPGAMPGAGRNIGIRSASYEWIAFLDAGITAEPLWLEELCRVADYDKNPAVLGTCQFMGSRSFEKAICALSYGQGQIHAVLPVSLFHRSVFDRVGWFRPELRAGEDILWQTQARRVMGNRVICNAAIGHYKHFPSSLAQAFRKWQVAEFHCVMAGVRRMQIPFYLIVLPGLYFFLFVGGFLGSALYMLYILWRAVITPMRRSAMLRWWGETPGGFWIPFWLAPSLDIAKFAGIIRGLLHICATFPKGRKIWNG